MFSRVLLERRRSRSGSSTRERELTGGLVTQAAVWPLVVVFLQLPPGEPPRLDQVGELLAVQSLVPQPAEERLGIAILPRTARLDVQHIQARLRAGAQGTYSVSPPSSSFGTSYSVSTSYTMGEYISTSYDGHYSDGLAGTSSINGTVHASARSYNKALTESNVLSTSEEGSVESTWPAAAPTAVVATSQIARTVDGRRETAIQDDWMENVESKSTSYSGSSNKVSSYTYSESPDPDEQAEPGDYIGTTWNGNFYSANGTADYSDQSETWHSDSSLTVSSTSTLSYTPDGGSGSAYGFGRSGTVKNGTWYPDEDRSYASSYSLAPGERVQPYRWSIPDQVIPVELIPYSVPRTIPIYVSPDTGDHWEHALTGGIGPSGMNDSGLALEQQALMPSFQIDTMPPEICFAAGTLVRTPDGWQAIETLRAGDLVLAAPHDDPTGPVTARAVVEAKANPPAGLLNVHVGETVIRATHAHPFYVHGRGWTRAENLHAGDLLRTTDGDWTAVGEIFDNGDVEPVFNLHVAEDHTYFVGDGAVCAVLVHNDCEEPGLNSGALDGFPTSIDPLDLLEHGKPPSLPSFDRPGIDRPFSTPLPPLDDLLSSEPQINLNPPLHGGIKSIQSQYGNTIIEFKDGTVEVRLGSPSTGFLMAEGAAILVGGKPALAGARFLGSKAASYADDLVKLTVRLFRNREKSKEAVEDAVNPTFVDQMSPSEAARYERYWGERYTIDNPTRQRTYTTRQRTYTTRQRTYT